mgnify:CR=1 FL=1
MNKPAVIPAVTNEVNSLLERLISDDIPLVDYHKDITVESYAAASGRSRTSAYNRLEALVENGTLVKGQARNDRGKIVIVYHENIVEK